MDKGNVQHLDWRTVLTPTDDAPADLLAALDAYFKPFAQPVHDERMENEKPHLCLNCDEPLNGFASMFLGKGGFEWGMVHGEGYCRGCGWPARAHHFIKDADGKDLATLQNVVLQYHPDVVETKAKAKTVPARTAA